MVVRQENVHYHIVPLTLTRTFWTAVNVILQFQYTQYCKLIIEVMPLRLSLEAEDFFRRTLTVTN